MTFGDHVTIRNHLPGLLFAGAAALLLCAVMCTRDTPNGNEDRIVSISVGTEGQGRVQATPADTAVESGTTVAFEAFPDSGSIFVGWSGDTQSTANPLWITVRADLEIRAVFATVPRSDMVLVHARDSSFLMGSNDPLAVPSIERPVHRVSFTYDFYLGRCEVTQKEYVSVVGVNPSAGRGYPDVGDSFPVQELTWYEAALFCNARSRAEGYDTVYSYTAVCPDTQTCSYVLEGLRIHYDRFGYRLPTEAEWEYACRAGSQQEFFWGADPLQASTHAWYFDNAANRSHPVGIKAPNVLGLYDMAGNAAEWVNDWLEPYQDSSVVNPVGTRDVPLEEYERSGERPVRGGSFGTTSPYLRSSARRFAPYATAAKIKFRGLGFRAALGVFYSASTGSGVYPTDTSLHVEVNCLKSDLVGFLGTSNVKLVFVQPDGSLGKLLFIDFTASSPAVLSIPDTGTAACPTISPNGAHVAYSSRAEGYTGSSIVSIRSLDTAASPVTRFTPGFIPRWWTGLSGGDTFLVYTDGASVNSSPAWWHERTLSRKMSGIAAAGAPEVLWQYGSYHGGLSRDRRFLGTSYTIGKLIDLQLNDTCLFYFDTPYNGRDDRPQICNLSMSPSTVRTDEALLLDFGYSKTSGLVGRPYGVHEFFFRCNSKLLSGDQVEAWYEKPAGFDSWNFVEYTNHPDFAVAVAESDYSDSSSAVFLIDLADSAYLRILSGPNLRDPWLWIDPAAVPETPDPYFDFARYDVPVQWTSQIILAKKMKLLWYRRLHAQVVFFGSSTTMYGIDPGSMPHYVGVNLGSCADKISTGAILGVQYALPHLSGLTAICLGLDPGWLRFDPEAEPLRLNGLYDSKGYELDRTNNFWRSGVPAAVTAKIDAFNASSWEGYDTTGYFSNPSTGSWGEAIVEWGDFSFSDTNVQQNLGLLSTLGDSAAARNVHVLVINFPENPSYGDSAVVGRFGPSRATYSRIVAWLDTLGMRNPFVHFYDANNGGNHDYADQDAFDCNHLGPSGAAKLSARVDSLLYGIIGQ